MNTQGSSFPHIILGLSKFIFLSKAFDFKGHLCHTSKLLKFSCLFGVKVGEYNISISYIQVYAAQLLTSIRDAVHM